MLKDFLRLIFLMCAYAARNALRSKSLQSEPVLNVLIHQLPSDVL